MRLAENFRRPQHPAYGVAVLQPNTFLQISRTVSQIGMVVFGAFDRNYPTMFGRTYHLLPYREVPLEPAFFYDHIN